VDVVDETGTTVNAPLQTPSDDTDAADGDGTDTIMVDEKEEQISNALTAGKDTSDDDDNDGTTKGTIKQKISEKKAKGVATFLPQTGDATNIALLAVLMLLCVVGAVTIIVRMRKRAREE
jgi:LPXTG-motif cell wall-anchored protein